MNDGPAETPFYEEQPNLVTGQDKDGNSLHPQFIAAKDLVEGKDPEGKEYQPGNLKDQSTAYEIATVEATQGQNAARTREAGQSLGLRLLAYRQLLGNRGVLP